MNHQQFTFLLSLSNEAEWANHFMPALSKYEIDTPLRQSYFFAQIFHESNGLTILEENLNYSADRLLVVFPKYFKTKADADKYARKPAAIANRVYGGRMGNGNEASGDGWKYRGRGPIQFTGKDNYRLVGARVFNDPMLFINNPDLLKQPQYGAPASCWFFQHTGCNELADKKDFTAVTKRINGGSHGLTDRLRWLAKIRAAA